MNLKGDVREGSVIGPLLLLVFVNDLPKLSPQTCIIMYADDSSYLAYDIAKRKMIYDAHIMLNKFVSWFWEQ